MKTAQQLISARVVDGFAEQRLSSLSAEIEELGAQYCVVLNPASSTIIGLVRFSDVAARPETANRILGDLMRTPPAYIVKEDDSSDAVEEILAAHGPQEVTVIAADGQYVGLITLDTFSAWLLEKEKARKAELEEMVADQRRFVDFLERKVSARMTEIRAALDKFSQICLVLSHDIRGPLRSIHGFADVFTSGEGGELNADGKEAALRIQRCSANADTLAETLLRHARDSFGESLRPFAAIDLNEVLTDALEFLDASIRQRGAKVTIRGPLHVVEGHYVAALQIFINLIGNSIKYVPERQTPLVEVWTEQSDEGVSLLIKDNGPGIQNEHREQLFSPLVIRPHQNGVGTGLGLTITQNALVQLGGEVDISSEENAGTLFRVKLRSLPSGSKVPVSPMDVASPTIATDTPFATTERADTSSAGQTLPAKPRDSSPAEDR